MRDRGSIIRDLLSLKGDLRELKNELSGYSWDSDIQYGSLDRKVFLLALEKAYQHQISHHDLAYWAELIELRDDIEIPDSEIKQALHEMATPELYGEITEIKVADLLQQLREVF